MTVTPMLIAIFGLGAIVTALFLVVREQGADPLTSRLWQVRRQAETPPQLAPTLADAALLDGQAAADGGEGAVGRGPLRALLSALDARLQRRGISRGLQAKIRRAGLRLLPAEFLAGQLITGIILAMAGGERLSGHGGWLLGLVGLVLPVIWLNRRIAIRLKFFEDQLSDTLSLLSNSLRSGYSLLQAMEVVSREMPEPMAKEIGQVLREARVGIPLDDALLAMGRRVPSTDLDLVITAVQIQRQVGGNLAEILEKIGETVRDRVRLLGHIKALTAQGRLSGWVVSLMPVALAGALFVLNKAYIMPLFTTPLGIAMLAMAGLMQLVGIMVIRSMVKMQV